MATERKSLSNRVSAFGRMVDSLIDGASVPELVVVTGLNTTTVQRYVNGMRKSGAIHVHMWNPDRRGRDILPVYIMGRGKDAKRRKLSHAERQRRYREKQHYLMMMHALGGEKK